MEFGRLDPNQLSDIDFSLPSDPQGTLNVLASSEVAIPTKIYIGCGRRGHKTWIGNFYPSKITEKDFLNEYVKHFNSIELRDTFYQVCTVEKIAALEAQTIANPDFLFYPLMPQSISHIRRLRNAEAITIEHINSLTAFGKKLGPSLLQLGEHFSPKNIAHLEDYLVALPEHFDLFVELRNKAWFEQDILTKVIEIFKAKDIGFAITDTPGRRDVLHMNLTTPHAFVRFSPSGNPTVDKRRLDFWCEKIDYWKSAGLRSLGFFINHPEPHFEPELCEYMIRKLGL
ncbi:DUF72 domain-containing protein [Mucilaginibacter kameinonensis]|uniref:DUF72 domain-containing protein n=1 Tax=Mucilaginibacter kameinonensis TaxID=452286 RepID=UPI000EF7E3A4|nr:DUF72 domain-containing protein [Mucilaginibacter kameinonensis]